MGIDSVGDNCVGCRACQYICRENCISFFDNTEGFEYPTIREDSHCTNCGLCTSVCPAINAKKHTASTEVFAAWIKDSEVLKQSSSGGLFSALAESVLQKNGAVFGCAFDDKLYAHHSKVETQEGLKKLRGSKYVQSDLGDTYPEIKDMLVQGKYILFVGTPCQVSGLTNFLKKDYENLLTVDLICHGVPSRKMFAEYIKWLEEKHGGSVLNYSFRSKEKNGWSLTYLFSLKRKNGKIKEYSGIGSITPYYYGFLAGYYYRLSCYSCKYCTPERVSDITLGDFWGVENQCPDIDSQKGVSAILINSDKGRHAMGFIQSNIESRKIAFEMVAHQNSNLIMPTQKPLVRDVIYDELNDKGFDFIAKTYLKPSRYWLEVVKSLIPNHIRQHIKRGIKRI